MARPRRDRDAEDAAARAVYEEVVRPQLVLREVPPPASRPELRKQREPRWDKRSGRVKTRQTLSAQERAERVARYREAQAERKEKHG